MGYVVSLAALLVLSTRIEMPPGIGAIAAIPIPLLAMRWTRLPVYTAIAMVAATSVAIHARTRPEDAADLWRIGLQILALAMMSEVARSFYQGSQRAAALRTKHAERYRMLVESANVIPWELDLESFRFTYVGPQAEALLGYPAEEWYTEGFWEAHLHPDDREQSMAFCAAATARGEDHDFEYRMSAADGRIVWLRDIVSIVGPRSRPVGLHGVMVDVTDVHERAARLAEANQRIAGIWQSAVDGMLITDPRNFRITEASPSMEALLGYEAGGLRGRDAFEVFSGPQDQREQFVARVLGGEPIHGWLSHVSSRSGEQIAASISASAHVYEGQRQILAVVRDERERLTADRARRDLERRVLESQKLESLGRMAGEIAHDFNNLLTGVLGNVSLVLEDTPEDAPARSRLDAVERAAETAAHLTRQMLAYSGRGSVVTQTEELSTIVREAMPLLSTVLSKNIVLQLNLSDSAIWVRTAPGQLDQIIMNLVTNAADALDGRGTIEIDTCISTLGNVLEGAIHSMSLSPGRYASLEVRDSGVGIQAGTIENIFDPFFTTKLTGRGLGLSAVYGIILGHGGALAVRSKPGKGSSFRVLLPLAEMPESASAVVREGDHSVHPSGPVLIVDDEAAIRDVTRRAIERAGWKTLQASNGAEALQILASSEPISVLLLDLTMPGLSGFEVLERVRAQRPDLPVLVMSGYSSEAISVDGDGASPVHFLPKPFRAAQLMDALEQLLQR